MTTRKTNGLVRFAVERRVTMTMIVVGVVVLGWISLGRIPLEFLPSFSSSNINVDSNYPSSSPEEVEREITLHLENSLSAINGIEELSSRSSDDRSSINVTFVDGTDMNWAAVEVRDRIDRVRHLLPDDLERVRVRRFQSTDIPVMRFQLSADRDKDRLFAFAEDILQRRLERLEGVAAVEIWGLRSPELQIRLDPARLAAHDVDVRTLTRLLRENNVNLSAGDLREGRRTWQVRAVGEFATPAEIRDLPIGAGGLRLHDLADVVYDYPEQWDYNFLNGVEALTVSINKDSDANLLAVVDGIKAELDAIRALPAAEGLQLRIYSDASEDVRKGLGQLRDTGLIGGLLAIVAVYLFVRRFRTTALVAVAIPISVVATFVLLYGLRETGLSDVTINVVSLAGLMLALGMLVDNSIVVIESVFRHREELGKDAVQSALDGTSEVALPITASTITTMCVFLPLIFLGEGGRFALFMENIGITICIVIVASLLVALTVVPMVAAILLRSQEPRRSRGPSPLARGYRWVLTLSLRHRFAFTVVIVLLLWGSWDLFNSIERSFSTRAMEREITINVDTPRQYTFDQTKELYDELYGLLDARREQFDIEDISHSYDRGTGRSRGGWSRNRRFNIHLLDEEKSDKSTVEVREAIREILPTRAGVNLRIASDRVRGGGSGIEVELMGDDPAVLELLSEQVVQVLQSIPDIRDVDTSLESGDEEIQVRVRNEQALAAGLSSRGVAMTVNNALTSRALSYFKTPDREIDMVMQYREEDRATLNQLGNVPVFGSDARIPLSAVADFEFVAGPRSIERENHQSKIEISANTTDPRANFRAMGAVTAAMDRIALPPGYEWSFGRWNRYQQRDEDTGMFALLFCLPLVYMVLASLFESFAQPLTIMFSVPFAMLGVGVVMNLAGQPWDNMTMLGLIVLVGVVVNNAIVLLDHINGLRRSGLPRTEAILTGGGHRLRPILITAVTTILGMFPMIAPILFPAWFGPLEGRAGTWAPIGLVIVGGLTTSTFLTLVIIPVLYSLIDDASAFVARVVRATARPVAVRRTEP